MLHRFAVTNLRCFRGRVELDFTVNQKVADSDWFVRRDSGERVSKAMVLVGANASGKTTLLKAITDLQHFMFNSFSGAEPLNGMEFSPHPVSVALPTEFECDFEANGVMWRYHLRCTPERVLHESLKRRGDGQRKTYEHIFKRDWSVEAQEYTISLWKFELPLKEGRKVRQNASLISTAMQYGDSLALSVQDGNLISNLWALGRDHFKDEQLIDAADFFTKNAGYSQKMKSILKSWDLGLHDIRVDRFPVPTVEEPNRSVAFPIGRHLTAGVVWEIPFALESSGTKAAFLLLYRILPVLKDGGLACIDELESDLHPHMLQPILDLFMNPETNPHNAQLIFTCHATQVLNSLQKEQITLVEKNQDCESEAYRLDQVAGVRSDDNFYGKYMAGAYGATPYL